MPIPAKFYEGITTASAEATMDAAEELALHLPEDCTLALQGDLGAGKTTFVKGLARAWSIQETITSPTFNIYSIYQGQRQLIHVDLYRLSGPGDWKGLMLDEFLISPFCLAIEWPERLAQDLKSMDPLVMLRLTHVESAHKIQVIPN